MPIQVNEVLLKEEQDENVEMRELSLSSMDRENVLETMNAEERNSHLFPVSWIICHFLAFAHHVSQTLNMKKPDTIALC